MIIAFSGRIGKDAETRQTQGGETVTSFTVASSTGRDKTTWVDCAIFGDRGPKLAPYLKKGTPVGINGFPSVRSWQDKDGNPRASLQCAVHHVDLLGNRQDRADDTTPVSDSSGTYRRADDAADLDDSIPF